MGSGADNNSLPDVYVTDLVACATTLVSVTSSGGLTAGGPSTAPSISADGRSIAFLSRATNLGGGTAGLNQVYVRDLKLRHTVVVSALHLPICPPFLPHCALVTPGDQDSDAPSISRDGRWVAFSSWATNLVGSGNAGHRQVYVFDRDGNQNGIFDEPTDFVIRIVSGFGIGFPATDGDSSSPVISDSGRFLAFTTTAPSLSGVAFPAVVRVDRDADDNGVLDGAGSVRTDLVARASGNPTTGDPGAAGTAPSGGASISADGNLVSFVSTAIDLVIGFGGAFTPDAFRRDLTTLQTIPTSVRGGGLADGDVVFSAALSADGGRVAIAAGFFNDLVNEGAFVRDVALGTTTQVEPVGVLDGGGTDGRDLSISADGRFVAFASAAALVTPDTTLGRDVFRVEL